MNMPIAILYSPRMKGYGFGTRRRFDDFLELFQKLLGNCPDFEVVEPRVASFDELPLVHDPEYVNDLHRRAEAGETHDLDTPLSPGLDEAARAIVGGSMVAGELVWEGRFDLAVALGGGLHHARRDREAGFCVFNDVAICARNLIQKYHLERILILDTDAHAGDGTQEIFFDDPRVLVISIHQDPATLYPGLGFAHEIGEGEGRGYTLNLPLPPGAAQAAYEYALDEVFLPLAREFRPQIILRSGGSDPHFADELTQLGLTMEGLRMIGRKVRAAADEICPGKLVDLLGSGYNAQVLPWGWLALISGASGAEVKLEEPFPIPRWLTPDFGFEETKRVVVGVKRNLRDHWQCLA